MSIVLNRKPDEDVAMAMELVFLCEEFHCLPGPGGLLDQDAYYVWLIKLVREAQIERSELDNKKKP